MPLIGKLVGIKSAFVQVLSLAAALELLILLSPFFMRWIIDDVLVSYDRDLLTLLAIGFGLLILIREIISYFRATALLHIGSSMNVQWTVNVFSHLVRLPASYFERRSVSDVVSRFDSTGAIQRTLTSTFVESVMDGVMMVITVVMMLLLSVPMTIAVSFIVAPYVALRFAFYPSVRTAHEAQILADIKQYGYVLETLRGIQTIKLFNCQEQRSSNFFNHVVESVNHSVAAQHLNIAFRGANGVLFGLAGIGLVWFGASQILDGTAMTIGTLIAFIAFKDQFVSRVSNLVDRFFEWRLLRLQAERLADIVLAPTEPADAPHSAANEHSSVAIEVENIYVRYGDGEPNVLEDVSLVVADGESVVITGPSAVARPLLSKLSLAVLMLRRDSLGAAVKRLKKLACSNTDPG